MTYRSLATVCVTLAALGAGHASAQVIEISDDGAATVLDGPAIYSSEGVRTLTPELPKGSVIAGPVDLQSAIQTAAARHAIDSNLVQAVAWSESRFHQTAISPKGAVGVMQLMDGTARDLGVDRFDLNQNIDGGAAYLSQLLGHYRGDVTLAVAAYNAGPGAVDRYGGVPPYRETRAYVRTVLDRLAPLSAPPVIQPDYPPVILIAP